MAQALTSQDVQQAWSALAQEIRTAVLLTMQNGRPYGSHAPYVFGSNWTNAYLHLSRLALHTQHLLADPHMSLFIAEPDGPGKNPLALRRMNLQVKRPRCHLMPHRTGRSRNDTCHGSPKPR